jgi:cytochrome b561-like protein
VSDQGKGGAHIRVRRYSGSARINHWIVAISFVLLLLSGLSLFHPSLYPISQLFGGGETVRWLHPWIGVVLVVAFLGLFLRFFWQNLPEFTDFVWLARIRHVLTANDQYLPEIGKYNAGQKFVFWSQFVLVAVLFVTGVGPRLFRATAGLQGDHRPAADGGAPACDCSRAGDRHLDHPRLCGDLGARYHQRHDTRHRERRVGLAPSPQMAAQGSRQGRDREGCLIRRKGAVRLSRILGSRCSCLKSAARNWAS